MKFSKGQIPWNKGKKCDKKTKEKISKTLLKNPTRFWKGKKMSKTHKENLRKSHLGYKMPKKQKERISESNKGKKGYWLGKKMTEETKRKMLEKKIGENLIFGKVVFLLNLIP